MMENMTEYTATEFLQMSTRLPVVNILRWCHQELEFATRVKMDEEGTVAIIKVPTVNLFRIVDKLWRVFTYRGLSFDRCIIAPHYLRNAPTAQANYTTIELSVNKDSSTNRLKIFFKR